MPSLVSGIAGGLLIVGGLAMIFAFPDITEYQSKQLSHGGILMGIIMIIIGVILLVM